MAIFGLLLWLTMLGFVVGGTVVATLGWRGRRILSTPRCPKCTHDLRRTDAVWEHCPECGLDLEKGARVSFGRFQRRPGLIVLGVAIALGGPTLMVLGTIAWTTSVRQTVAPAPPGPPGAPAGALMPHQLRAADVPTLVKQLTLQHDEPWVWQELERRRQSGDAGAADLQAAMEGVLASIDADAGEATLWGRQERQVWRAAGIIDDDLAGRWTIHFAGWRARLPARARPGQTVRLVVMPTGQAERALLACLDEVADADGAPLDLTFDGRGSRPCAVSAGRTITGQLTLPDTPGEHELTVTLTVGQPPAALAAGLERALGADRIDWPDGVESHQKTLTASITLVPEDQPLVRTVVDPALRAVVRSLLAPTGVSAVRHADGRVRLEVIRPGGPGGFHSAALPPDIPLYVRQEIRVDERVWPAGRLSFDGGATSWTAGGVRVRDFDRSIDLVDIAFVVDPEFAAEGAGDRPIWGEDIIFEDIPVTWVDETPEEADE